MTNFIIFIGGALAASAALGMGLYTYIMKVRAKEKKFDRDRDKLDRGLRNLRKSQQELSEKENAYISFGSLRKENEMLKQDLFNLAVAQKKGEEDSRAIEIRQNEIEGYANAIAGKYLKDNVRWISDKVNANNFVRSKKQLLKVINDVRSIGYDVPEDHEKSLVDDLKELFEKKVRLEFEKEEQARIRAQIREEQRIEREVEKQIKDADREREVLRKALEAALQKTHDEHSAEVEALREKLREAEAKAERAKSQAQLTKSGYVYVISNIGSFGDDVFKIGMTRRLEPMDRVKELGDASVPFPFDVHMMISCDDAPSLENKLHKEFHKRRLNKVNNRKEFFKVGINDIISIVEKNHGSVEYQIDPEALQYREGLEADDSDEEYIDEVMESLSDD